MSQSFNHSAFAKVLADQMVKERFGSIHGTHDLGSYFDFVDARQTAHLSPQLAKQVKATAGAQRRRIKLSLENGGVIAKVPMKDPRSHGATIWAEIELGTLFDLIENGANNAWGINYASKIDRKGYVKTTTPLRSLGTATNVTVGRLVAGANKGRSVRFIDRNPLNLRRNNLFVYGNPSTCEGGAKNCKHDARALVRERSRIRASLVGADYGIPEQGEV